MKEKLKTIYVCTNCGETSPRWLGRCPSCGQWNTLVEDVIKEEPATGGKKAQPWSPGASGPSTAVAKRLADIDTNEEKSRIVTSIKELDRVLGGGIVLGSVVLLGGEPGAGKSTMLLQLCGAITGSQVLYVTGEESTRQIKLRAKRLNVPEDTILVAAESNIDEIVALIEETKPSFAVIDSIQTMYTPTLSSSAGSVSQVKECAARLLAVAKGLEIPVFIVGHVNKDGAIAGPKVMEHIVDTVLYFEGDRTLPYRILRATKNRYGSTNEIGMFDMTGAGLIPIDNPSEMLLEGRPLGVSGNCVGCIMEGSRPIMSEIQALATKSGFGTPRRTASGFDSGRANLLMAVLEKRVGFFMGNLDVYINVVGGLELSEPACDLALCLAIVSSLTDQPVADSLLAIGEVGLGGEIRSVNNLEIRLREAQRIGFKKAIVPEHNIRNLNLKEFPDIKIVGAKYLKQAITQI
ncbi:DNA repair protein RadA [Ruminococcaceae bacterium OttesenSCG-928-A16]|nr:DNA repair protein RadA [Ruminococcaceae bacterium OttesenSCG-928-A16]